MRARKKQARGLLEVLSKSLRGKVFDNDGICRLQMDPTLGSGSVRSVCFNMGFSVLEFDITLKEDIILCSDLPDAEMIFFLYCLKGNCFQKFENSETLIRLDELQTAVISSKKGTLSQLVVKKNSPLVFNLIQINKSEYFGNIKHRIENNDIDLQALLESFNTRMGVCHLGSINLEIGELIKSLANAKFASNLASLLNFEGICHLILAKQIEQYDFYRSHGKEAPNALLQREMKQIGEIADFIRNSPEIEHSINSLSTKSGLSPAKLQLGFRFSYDCTVGEYIRNMRLQKAEYLLRSTDMNISEVVYSIGLTSRSYFCKIFKNKFLCSPKQFKNRVTRKGVELS
ncbi:MAG: AraC family transcriptional regulator [Saonia sp.]